MNDQGVIQISPYYSLKINGVTKAQSGAKTVSAGIWAMGGYYQPNWMDSVEYAAEDIDTIIRQFQEARALLTGEGND